MTRTGWRTSIASMGNGECVEVGSDWGTIAVRDSKDPGGPVLVFTPGAWQAFVQGLAR